MNELNKMVIGVEGMSCNNCAKHVKNALEELTGVKEAVVNLDMKNAEISYEGELHEEEISKAIVEAGYEFTGIEER